MVDTYRKVIVSRPGQLGVHLTLGVFEDVASEYRALNTSDLLTPFDTLHLVHMGNGLFLHLLLFRCRILYATESIHPNEPGGGTGRVALAVGFIILVVLRANKAVEYLGKTESYCVGRVYECGGSILLLVVKKNGNN